MKKIFLPLLVFTLSPVFLFTFSSCHMAPKDNPGDTVAASAFEPIDTAAVNAKQRAYAKLHPVKDSVDIFYVGEGSTKSKLQLVSYPSKKDTLLYSKARHMKKNGNADFGHVVRVKFYISHGDSLVNSVEEVK